MNATPESVTTFAETCALFAVMDDDLPKARRVIADWLPHERKMFAGQLARLLNMLGEPCQECGDLTPTTLSVTKPVFGPDSRYLCRTCADVDEPVTAHAANDVQAQQHLTLELAQARAEAARACAEAAALAEANTAMTDMLNELRYRINDAGTLMHTSYVAGAIGHTRVPGHDPRTR